MRAAVTTMLAAAAGAVTAGAVIWLRTRHLDVAMTGNGVLAGLVGITAGTAAMSPVGAVLTGAVAGVIVVGSVAFFDRIRIDDPVGAISVHGVIFEHGQPGYVFTTADDGSEFAEAVSHAKARRGRNGAELDQADVGA